MNVMPGSWLTPSQPRSGDVSGGHGNQVAIGKVAEDRRLDGPATSPLGKSSTSSRAFSRSGSPGDPNDRCFTVCGPQDLTYDNDRLRFSDSDGAYPVDLVYKRFLWKDLLESEGTDGILKAIKRGHVCMVNAMRSRLMGNKGLLWLISNSSDESIWGGIDRDAWRPYLNRQQSRPFIDAEDLQLVLARPRDYVVKQIRGYGSKNVLMGGGGTRSTRLDATSEPRLRGGWMERRAQPPAWSNHHELRGSAQTCKEDAPSIGACYTDTTDEALSGQSRHDFTRHGRASQS